MEFKVIEIDPPLCHHGPTILFEPSQEDDWMNGENDDEEESSSSGKSKKRKRNTDANDKALSSAYFACSAYRGQKECNFKMQRIRWIKMTDSERQFANSNRCPPQTGELVNYIFDDTDLDKEYGFCTDCCRVLVPRAETIGFELDPEHIFGTHISKRCVGVRGQLKREFFYEPTKLLTAKRQNKGQSQFFFAEPVKRFLVEEIIVKMGFTRVLCLGCPTIFEYIFTKKKGQVEAFLLDIDHRFAQFVHPNNFSRFNMFNYYFFDGLDGENSVRQFLAGGTMENTLFLCDPPFGVRVTMLKKTIRRFQTMIDGWAEIDVDDDESPYPAFGLCFPYFNEHWIKSAFNGQLERTDFVMFYDNHGKFKLKGKGTTTPINLSSPVRLFTNIDRSEIDLTKLNADVSSNPEEPFYSYCNICKRCVFKTNKHCKKCNECSARVSNKIYKHCDKCGTCFKNTWNHCDKCKRCHLFLNCPKNPKNSRVDNNVVQSVSMLVNDKELYLLTQSQMRVLQTGNKINCDFRAID